MAQESTRSWFFQEVFVWRCLQSVIWSILLQFGIVTIGSLFLGLKSWNPVNEIFDWISRIFSFSFLSCQICMSIALFFVVLLHVKSYSLEPEVYATRASYIWRWMRPICVISLAVHAACGSFIVRFCLGFAGDDYQNLFEKCDSLSDLWCLNETHLFLVIHGLYTGLLFTSMYINKQLFVVSFPPLQQLKFFVFKSKFRSMLYQTSYSVIMQIRWFYLLYFLFGSSLKDQICESFHLNVSPTGSLAHLQNLLSPQLLWGAWLTGTMVQLSWICSIAIFQICLTERYTFPVETPVEDQNILKEIIKSDMPLLKHLGFLDLKLLSQNSAARRLELFSISHPGGHSYHWDAISTHCLSLIDVFTKNLTEVIAISSGQLPSLIGSNYISRPYWVSQSVVLRNSSTPQSCIPSGIAGNNLASPIKINTPSGWLINKIKQLLYFVQSKPAVNYFVSTLPESRSQNLFKSCQLVTWAVEALSYLVCASRDEDRYGVVQKMLSNILSSLLELDVMLDKYQKHIAISRRPISREQESLQKDVQLRKLLQHVVSSGLYHISHTFGRHLSSLSLTEEHHQHLMNYIEFKQ